MMKNSYIVLLLSVFSLQTYAQDLSNYKYIIIPKQFSFQKEPNQYQVTDLTKFLFKKYGFDAYISGETLPSDANANGCNTLSMEADSGGFLGTHLTYTLANCQGQVVYTSPEGKSKIKQYKGAYTEVMREAMEGLEELGYTYSDEVIQLEDRENTGDVATTEVDPASMPEQTTASETSDKTVVVSATPENNPTTASRSRTQNSNSAQNTSESRPKTLDSELKSATFKSTDGSYMLKPSSSGFDFYEGETKIGEARQTSAGSYLVNTSEFVGVGSLEGDTFTVEREIKGVDGLIKMTFKAE